MIQKKWKTGVALVGFLTAFLGMTFSVRADTASQLMQADVTEKNIVAYLETTADDDQISCQIGQTVCDEIQTAGVEADQIPIHTIVLVDNSLSITEENKQKAIDILKAYVEGKSGQDYVTLATYGEDIQFLVEKSNDGQALSAAIDEIEQNNQDTYLTDVLYDLLDELEAGEYTRFIVLSDGVDNKAIGITREEVTEKLKSNSHPIYTLGHIYKDNDSELENLFAFSRATNGEEFLLDDIDDIDGVVAELISVQGLKQVTVSIPEELQDGSSKSVLFTVQGSGGETELRTQLNMPFSIKQQEAAEEPEPVVEEPEPEPEPVVEEPVETVEEPEPVVEETSAGIDPVTILAVLVLIVAVVLLIVVTRKKGGKTKETEKKKKKNEKKEEERVELPSEETVLAFSDMPDIDEGATVLVDSRYLLVLKDVQNPEKIFKYPLDGKVTLGRNVDKVNIAIDYNRTVSGQHCQIYTRNNRFYINDLNSANKTYVNGRVITGETEITPGTKIRLGEVEFSVEMFPI